MLDITNILLSGRVVQHLAPSIEYPGSSIQHLSNLGQRRKPSRWDVPAVT